MTDAKTCINDAQEKMDMAVMYLEEALAHIRAGKASTRLLDGIRVDSYGSMVHAASPSSHGTRVCSASSKKQLWIPNSVSLPKIMAKSSV